MSSLFRLEGTKLFFENGVELGEILRDVDGYYKWWPNDLPGYLDEEFLFAIASYLQSLNAEWDAQVKKELSP